MREGWCSPVCPAGLRKQLQPHACVCVVEVLDLRGNRRRETSPPRRSPGKRAENHDPNPIFLSVLRFLLKKHIKSTTFGTDLETFHKHVDDENNMRNKMQE